MKENTFLSLVTDSILLILLLAFGVLLGLRIEDAIRDNVYTATYMYDHASGDKYTESRFVSTKSNLEENLQEVRNALMDEGAVDGTIVLINLSEIK